VVTSAAVSSYLTANNPHNCKVCLFQFSRTGYVIRFAKRVHLGVKLGSIQHSVLAIVMGPTFRVARSSYL
jgi:hypothetical protein